MSKQLAPIDQVRSSLKLMEPQFKMALPSHVTVEKFTRTLLTSLQQSPALLGADRTSLFAACMKAAASGLLPDGKEAAFVMFKDKVQYMPMISGLLKLVRNSGELSSITSQIIYEKDTFKYWVDSDGEHLTHEPNLFSDRGRVIGCYALAKTKDDSIYIEVMTEAQVNDVRNVSRSKDSGPWSGAFKYEMWKKTVLRRLIKRLPLSTDVERVINEDDDVDFSSAASNQQPKIAAPKTVSRLESLVVNSEVADEDQPVFTGIATEDNTEVL